MVVSIVGKGRFLALYAILTCALALQISSSAADELGNICVVFVVDTSGSMNDVFTEVTDALVGFVGSTRDGDMVAILNFDNNAHLYSIYKADIYLREFAEEMLTDRRFLSPREPGTGQTQIIRGLRKAYQLVEKLERGYSYPSYAIILLTDGDHYPKPDSQEWERLMNALKQKPWSRFAVSLKRESDEAVRRIADEFSGEAFYYDRSRHGDLKRILDSIRKRILIEISVSASMMDFGKIDAGKVYTSVPVQLSSSSSNTVALLPQTSQKPFEADLSLISFGPDSVNVPDQDLMVKLDASKGTLPGDYAGILRFEADKTVILRDLHGQVIDGIYFRFHVNSWWEKYWWTMVLLVCVSLVCIVFLILLRPKRSVVEGTIRVLRSPDETKLPEGRSFQLASMKKAVVKIGSGRDCEVKLDFDWIPDVQFQVIAEAKKIIRLNRLSGTILIDNREVYRDKQLDRENRIILRQKSSNEKEFQPEEIELQYKNPALPRKS